MSMFLARSSGDKVFIEHSAETVAENLNNSNAGVTYYYIALSEAGITLHKVSIKSGVRTSAPLKEIVEIEANGAVVGSGIVDA